MKTKLIAEIGINHNGDIKLAKELIDIAVLGGCQYVKFQKRTIEDVYTKEELDKERKSPWGTTNREQKKGLEFDKEEYDEIDKYCKEKGIKWFGSPWDAKSVDFLMQYNPDYIKIASATLTNKAILNRIKYWLDNIEENIEKKQTKVIIATGMSNEEEINNCLNILGNKVEYILSCTSTYPTKTVDMNMKKIITLKNKYPNYKIGFSNHSSGILFITMAATLNCEIIEYHITKDRTLYGSDQASSIEISGVIKIKDYVENIENSWGTGDINCLENEIEIKKKLRK